MKEIPVTRSRRGTAHIIQVDDEDYDRVMEAGPWHVEPSGSTYYATRNVVKDGRRTTQKLHRFILGDVCIGKHVDHIDSNGINDQRSNLRVCTHAENLRNRGAQKDNTSGFKGVSRHKTTQRWRASINIDGKWRHLGLFDTPEEAYAVYCEAAVRLHGQFARLK